MHKIKSIQLLRGVAAVLVVIRHCWGGPEFGSIGVDLFFVISGFIMVYTCHETFGHAKTSLPFIVRRFTRIVPSYWVSTFLIVLLVGPTTYDHLLKSLFLVPEIVTPMNAPAWTLMYEVSFYILFSLFLPFRQSQAVILLFACLLIVSMVGTYSTSLYFVFYGRPLILEFGMGAVIGFVFNQGFRLDERSALVLSLLSFCVCVLSSLSDQVNGANWERLCLWGIPSALVVLAAVCGPTYRFTRLDSVAKIGDASYSIYITHWIWIITYAGRFPLLATINAIIFGIGFYVCIEKPLVRFCQSTLSERGLSQARAIRWAALRRLRSIAAGGRLGQAVLHRGEARGGETVRPVPSVGP